MLFRRFYLSCASHSASSSRSLITSFGASCQHHSFFRLPPPWNPCSHANTSKNWLADNHYSTAPLMCTMYVANVIPYAFNTSPNANVTHIPYMVLRAFFRVILLRNFTWILSTVLAIDSAMSHESKTNYRTAFTTA